MNYFDSRSSLRVSDFFCVIGLEDEIIPFCQATRIMGMGSVDNLMEVPFSATVLDRYPLFDRVDAVFPEGVELFCFPEGIKLYDSIPPPSFHSFIHTSEEGIHSLGCCLKFYEPMEVMHCDRLKALFPSKNDELDDSNYFVPKSLCLISIRIIALINKSLFCFLHLKKNMESSDDNTEILVKYLCLQQNQL